MALELETEWATYQRELPRLLENEGKFVLIIGEEVVDLFGTYVDALRAGYRRAQLNPFLVKQILQQDRIHFLSRFIEPCLI